MTVALEHYQPSARALDAGRAWIDLMAPAVELAKAIAGTDFVRPAMRHNPAAIAAAILYGDEVGLGPMVSLAQIAIIEGKPALSAEAQRGLIYAAGHDLWIEELTVTAVTWAGRRSTSEAVTRVTWTLDDARRAGLAGRPSWRNYPRAMLSARASAELARAVFADVTGGLAAIEELEEPDQAAAARLEAVAGDIPGSKPRVSRRRARKLPAVVEPGPPLQKTPVMPVASSPEPELPPLPGEEHTPEMSASQRRKLMALFRDLDLGGNQHRSARLNYAAAIIGRDITSSSDLTADEAHTVIDALEAMRDDAPGEAPAVIPPNPADDLEPAGPAGTTSGRPAAEEPELPLAP